jgi:hypothetical protein
MIEYLISAFHTAYPDAPTDLWSARPSGNSWSVDDVHALILSRIVTQPHRVHVVIIEHADTLSKRAADRLLTVFEQPPSPTLWVLCTTSPASLPVTIRSRTSTTIVHTAPPASAVTALNPTATPALSAFEIVSSLPADKGEARLAARALIEGFRAQLGERVANASTPELWLRLHGVALALDSAEEILRTNGTATTALALVLRALGPDVLPDAIRFEMPISAPRPAKVQEVIATFETPGTQEEPDWLPPASNAPRWSPGPPFAPRKRRVAAI